MSRLPVPQRNWSERDLVDWMAGLARRQVTGSFTWDPPSVNAGATVDTTLTTASVPALEGMRTTMLVHVSPPALTSGLHVTAAWVASDDTLTVRLYNSTVGAINQGSGTWMFRGEFV